MPVIVVGADTPLGNAAVDALLPGAAELRAFVSDPEAIEPLKARGIKVAIGDISDGSHVGGAALNAFCAVLVATAAVDERERSFADSAEAVVAAWAEGVSDARVHRVIWVDDGSVSGVEDLLAEAAVEFAVVATGGRSAEEAAAEIARLESQREV